MGSPARLAVPRPSKRARQALPSRREGNRTAPTPRSNRSAAIVCVMARRLVVISCRSRCCRSCEQQFDVAILDLLACEHVGEIDQVAIELQDRGNEHVLYAPLRGDWLLSEVLGGLGSVALDVAVQRAEVGPEVGWHLAETRFRQVGATERAVPRQPTRPRMRSSMLCETAGDE
jgi:hypothetical protein